MSRRRAAAVAMALAALGPACAVQRPSAATREASAPAPGHVNLVRRTDPSFDRFTDRASPQTKRWMTKTLARSVVFTPYFDDKLSWNHTAWVYADAYALTDAARRRHPDWVARDVDGNPLYIPFDCSGGTCPQWAADITNATFRRQWIARAAANLAKGYKGVWVDDVNLDLRTSDGDGRLVRPVDPGSGRPLTDAEWREAMARFMQEVRTALPKSKEIVHNSIWYAGGAQRGRDPSVRKEIAAADYINLERGINDPGLTGGTGAHSLMAFLAFVDRVHAAGAAVILEGMATSDAGRAANLAAYLLVSNGHDGVAFGSLTPESTYRDARLDLGKARGPRRLWKGLLRRDFAGGLALLAPPGGPPVGARLSAADRKLVDAAGRRLTDVVLEAGHGLVLRR